MVDAIKINYLNFSEGSIKPKYYVFSEHTEDISEIFDSKELKYIGKNKVPVQFIKKSIHLDDTIDIIKRKIIQHILNISFEEIYIFSITEKKINTFSIYNELTQNEKIKLRKESLFQFLQNFYDIDITNLENKEFYDYEDLLPLKLDEKKQFIKIPLGQEFKIDYSFHYTINPFDTLVFGKTLQDYAQDFINTAPNRDLLFKSGKLYKNTIFLCSAGEVLQFSNKKSLSQELFIKVYFPLLYHHQFKIDSFEKLQRNQMQLLTYSKKELLNKTYKDINEDVDLFHNIYYKRKNDLKYDQNGIKQLNFIIKTDYRILIPLETIFKLLHTSKTIPLIKYNPGNRFENIYRLYSNKTSKRGKKIPLLSKNKIIKLRKNIAKHRQVSVYILVEKYEIICNFEKNGSIHIDLDLNNLISVEEAEQIIKTAIKPLLSTVGDFLGQSGYSYLIFDKLNDPNITIKNITYASEISIKKKFNITKFNNCISSIFNIIDGKLKNGIILRFKRTSYFKKEESKNAYMIELIQKETSLSDIKIGLMQNFKMSETEANELVADFIQELETEATLHGERKIRIRSNPGFPVFIKKIDYENKIIIQINNINHIEYMKLLPIYIDTLIRLTQDVKSTNVSQETINKFCRIIKDEIQDAPELPPEPPTAPYRPEDDNTNVSEDEDGFFAWDDNSESEGEENVQPEIVQEDEEGLEEGALEEGTLEEGAAAPEEEPAALEEGTLEEEPAALEEEPAAQEEEPAAQEEEPAAQEEEAAAQEEEPAAQEEEPAAQEESLAKRLWRQAQEEQDADTDDEDEGKDKGKPVENNNVALQQLDLDDNEQGENLEFGEEIELGENLEIGDNEQGENLEFGDEIELDEQGENLELDENEEGDVNLDFGNNFEIGGDIGFEEMSGGGANNDNLEKDIAGMRLAHPNPFQEKMKKLDKALFLKPKSKGFTAYSRVCPSNVKRQPVILTDEEKLKIDSEHPGSYSSALKYGSDPEKQYWYICPRYWCLTGNYSLTEEEVKAGVCGGPGAVIPTNASIVPEGGQIYEFASEKYHKKDDGSYVQHGPGFTKGNKIHKDLCVPCCFKNWNSAIQQKRRKQCQEREKTTSNVAVDDYIKGGEKFPLEQRRWGFLPESIQKFLGTDNKKCLSTGVKRELKDDHMCFLRQGIFLDTKQSFIECIADIYSKMTGVGRAGTFSKGHMKEVIIDSLDENNFNTFKRGTLVEEFGDFMDDRTKYVDKVKSALTNFSNYLRDDDVEIGYEYVWDILSTPNVKLFTNGLNIIILNIPDDDITNNIEIICSTDIMLDLSRPSVFIMKKDNLYEPIYGYTSKNDSIIITPSFLYNERGISPNIKNTLFYLSKISVKCSSLPSLPNIYRFEKNINLEKLIKNIKKINYTILKQVVNFNSKTIGLIIKKEKMGFVPCKPSSINKKYEYVFMDEDGLWNDYDYTINFLRDINTLSKNEIPCKPKLKVEEDGFIVGIITQTDQFIPLSRPNENLPDDLKTVKGYNYLLADKETFFNKEVDNERIYISKKINLETQFYNIFRNTVRILLQQYRNKKNKKDLEDIIQKPYLLYSEKLNLVTKILREILQNHIKFVQFSQEVLKNIDILSNCLKSNECNKSHCLSEDGGCKLLIPEKHLISKNDNKEIYFGRMADELIRFGRIRQFIFKPHSFISFQKVNYNLHKDEIILLEHLLDEEYWKDILFTYENPYLINKGSFDYVQPSKTISYSSKVDITNDNEEVIEDVKKDEKEAETEEEEKEDKKESKCVSAKYVKGKEWKKIFKKTYQSIFFDNTAICTWQMVSWILYNFLNRNFEVSQIKQELIDEYKAINDWQKVSHILEVQGKMLMVVRAKRANWEDLFQSEDYYVTNLDLFLIIRKYKIPTVFISGTPLKETGATNPKKIISFLYGNKKCCVIRTPGLKRNKPGKYSLLTKDGQIFLSIENFPNDFKALMGGEDLDLSFNDYYNRVASKRFQLVKQKIVLE